MSHDFHSLSEAFYARVKRDPVLGPLFPGKSLHCAVEELSAFLVQHFGGPNEDTQRRWWVSLRESHARFKIGAKERDAWLTDMYQTLEERRLSHLRPFFEQISSYIAHLDSPGLPPKILEMDEAVAAVRRGEIPPPIGNRSVFVGLLGLMIRGRNEAQRAYVRACLTADPGLVNARYGGRTLLQEAVAAGHLAIVELLLRLGADLNAGTHTALYTGANECRKGGRDIVRALLAAGADVNFADGSKRCTPLHMAARRGNVEIAETLLDCGAEIDARDSKGDTPLQRALNCRQTELASLLFERGARHAKQ